MRVLLKLDPEDEGTTKIRNVCNYLYFFYVYVSLLLRMFCSVGIQWPQ